jgi:hypothetical protein
MSPLLPDGLPVPGSREALLKGCRCPVGWNNRGTSAPFSPDGWFISDNCDFHHHKLNLKIKTPSWRRYYFNILEAIERER